jgi:hypothetical protein
VIRLWRWLRGSYRKSKKRRADVALEELLEGHEQAQQRGRGESVSLPPMQYREPPVG